MAGMHAGGGAGDAAVRDRGQPGDRHPAAHDAPDAMEYLTGMLASPSIPISTSLAAAVLVLLEEQEEEGRI